MKILKVKFDMGSRGYSYRYIIQVTDKVIKVAHNDIAVGYYNRSTGCKRPSEKFGGHIANLPLLERFLKEHGNLNKNGVYVWKSKFKFRVNSKGKAVDTGYTPFIPSKVIGIYSWLEENGFEVVKLY